MAKTPLFTKLVALSGRAVGTEK